VAKAWEEAYDFLAKTLVKIEENLYQRIYWGGPNEKY
jgi:hemoglobin-like flavoprotein